MEKEAEIVLNSKKAKRAKDKRFAVYFDGDIIYGYKGKIIWASEKTAKNAIIGMLTENQFVYDAALSLGVCYIKAFSTIKSAEKYIDSMLSSGRLVIKEINL